MFQTTNRNLDLPPTPAPIIAPSTTDSPAQDRPATLFLGEETGEPRKPRTSCLEASDLDGIHVGFTWDSCGI